MESKELMLGNWVWSVYKPYGHEQGRQYTRITADTIYSLSRNEKPNSFELSGIELTPEILEIAGFIKMGIGHYMVIPDRFGKYRALSLAYNNDNATSKYYTYYRECNRVSPDNRSEDSFVQLRHDLQYLHQLQNLYFALTGTHLKIELK